MGLEILAALRAAHALGIVHRDVKPANILMAPDRAVLVDFGIAQAAETSADATTAGMLIGSPAYIAPERARGGPSGPPADLWGLGASLYAAVEGSGPFEREGSALASLTAVVADEPELATRAGPLLWPVISGLLRKDPGQRLDAVEAERMLSRAAAPAPPVSPAPTVSTVTRGRRRSKMVAPALVGAAVLVVASATGAVLDRPSQARHQTAAVAAPPAAGPSAQPASTPPAGTGLRHRAADPTTGMPDRTHLTSRTSPAPSLSAAGSASPGVKAQPDNTLPPGHSTRPGKPGNGNGKGKGKAKPPKPAK